MNHLTNNVDIDEHTFISMVVALNDLQSLNNKQLDEQIKKLNTPELHVFKSQLVRLSKKLSISSHVYVGKRVAKGIVAGIKPAAGQALVDGPDFHEWCDIKTIEL